MNILILHRVPYPRIEYHRGIDHDKHCVTYFGKREILASIPDDLRCSKVERPGSASAFEEARDWLTESKLSFDAVISLSEYELIDAAQLREHFGIPGKRVDQVMLTRDKVLMKQAVARAGLRTPRFLPLRDLLFVHGATSWKTTTVLKPHSGASSADVVVFDSSRQVFDAIRGKRTGIAKLDGDRPDIGQYQVEEFVRGRILHFDGLIAQGELLAITVSQYVGTCLDYARGQPLGSFHFTLTDEAREWARRVLNAVSIHDGSFHLEAIDDGAELVFLEVGNRVGGADVVATFELATGIHMPSLELRILLGEAVSVNPSRLLTHQLCHGWFVYPGHHVQQGTFQGFDGVDEFRNSPAVLSWNELDMGRQLAANVTYSAHEAPLTGIVATTSSDHTREWIERLFASASLRVSASEFSQ